MEPINAFAISASSHKPVVGDIQQALSDWSREHGEETVAQRAEHTKDLHGRFLKYAEVGELACSNDEYITRAAQKPLFLLAISSSSNAAINSSGKVPFSLSSFACFFDVHQNLGAISFSACSWLSNNSRARRRRRRQAAAASRQKPSRPALTLPALKEISHWRQSVYVPK